MRDAVEKNNTALRAVLKRLGKQFGEPRWWPVSDEARELGRVRDEIIIGAVLTQNCAWTNVEKALANLREAGVCYLAAIDALEPRELAKLITPAGYFNVKAKRLQNTTAWFRETCDFDLSCFDDEENWPDDKLRTAILEINGVGEETCDDIVLYAFDRPSFVIDVYTRRFMERHGFSNPKDSYRTVQQVWENALPRDVQLYSDAHAYILRLHKTYCHKRNPNCAECPLKYKKYFASQGSYEAWRTESN